MLTMASTMGLSLGHTLETPAPKATATPLDQNPWGWDTGVPR